MTAPAGFNVNSWVNIRDYHFPGGWQPETPGARPGRAAQYCRQLEAGEILFFPGVPFDLPADDLDFLLSQKQAESRFHKNISYRPLQEALHGASAENAQRLRQIMRRYSQRVTAFVEDFLAPYAAKLALDFASFRPLEEQGRDLPLHKRNDLLHVDAFPTRPTRGGRILRVFTNINPTQPRIWTTGAPFHQLAPRYARDAGLERFAAQSRSSMFKIRRSATRAFRRLGLPLADRSAYDLFMLHFHDWLKENSDFQNSGALMRSEFPSGSTWLVYTDGVPHAALTGQFALEHTYIVPPAALVEAKLSPIRVLEELTGVELA
jgi:3-deoxy-D-manno-oct-2-ulosonic acid (Kdo) hydroxylase